ncbi:MAG: amidohydrolase [Ruminococcus sp.]|nr:amidohydrolase [Ruminococcus sp.]
MIRFKNGRVMTMVSDTSIENLEVWVDKDKISFVGLPTDEMLKNTVFEREIDLEGNLLMPSFKNAHTHSAMTFLRSYADDMALQDWLFKQVFPMEAKLNGEHIYWLSKLAILEYLTSGITANFDMYFELDDYVKAHIESGFRTVLCGSVSGEASNAERLEGYYNKFNDIDPLVSFRLGFHAEYTAERELMEAIGSLAEKYNAPVSVHNSETAKEVAECIEKYGKTPTELFDSMGIYNYGGAGFHCVHMSENDMEIFKNRGVYAVSCPASNAKLASGIAPLSTMSEKGIALALGTDGPASNNCLDMFREMFLMTALQKIAQKDAAAFDAQKVLFSATKGSALAMGLDNCVSISEGMQADLIVLDLNQPNMQPLNNIGKNIVYSGSKQNVKLTMCAGRVLYENGVFNIGEQPDRIYARANEIITEFSK